MEVLIELTNFGKKIINTCKFCKQVNYNEHKEIISDVVMKIGEKIHKGKVPNHFDGCKHYFYMSLNNACGQYLIRKHRIENKVNYDIKEYDDEPEYEFDKEPTQVIDSEKVLELFLSCCDNDIEKYLILYMYNGVRVTDIATKFEINKFNLFGKLQKIRRRVKKKYEYSDFLIKSPYL
jgi:DNA-directed RNA polymerase specialized sigma24 family protein